MATVRKIDSVEEFEKLEPIWNDLLGRNETDVIFLTYEWLHTWWRIYGHDRRLYILAVEDDDQTVGLAPLMQSGGVIRFIGTPNIDYCDFIGENKKVIVEEIISYLNRNRDEWSRVELSQIPEDSSTRNYLSNAAANAGLLSRMKKIETCYSYKFEGASEERREFSLKRGSSLKRFMNFFKKMGDLSLRCIENRDEIASLLPRFYHCHNTRWRDKTIGGKFEKADNRLFHDELVKVFDGDGRLKLMVLSYGETPLAYLYAFDYKGRLNLYNIATETFYEKKSAGIILLHLLTEKAVREGCGIIDFSRGEGSHKARFINGSSDNYQFNIYSGRFEHFLSGCYDSMKKMGFVKKIIENRKIKPLREKLSDYYSQKGPAEFIRAVLGEVLKRILDYRVLLVFANEKTRPEQPSPRDDLEIIKPGPDDIEKIASFLGFAVDSDKHKTILERFTNGSICYAVMKDGLIVAMNWAVFKRDHIPGYNKQIDLADNEVILSDSYTSPLYRGQGIYYYLTGVIVKDMLDRGHKMVSVCYRNNPAPVVTLKKYGFSLVSRQRYLKILGIRLI